MVKTVIYLTRFVLVFLGLTLLFSSQVTKSIDERVRQLLPPESEFLDPPATVEPNSVGIQTHWSFLPIIRTAGNVYYVATNGNDANPGTIQRPWRTINKATAMANPGDVIFVREGIYNERVILSKSGTQQLPIRFSGYPGEIVVIDGNYVLPDTWTGLVLLQGDWIIVSDLEVRESDYIGVSLEGKHNHVDNVFSHHNIKNGILIKGDFGIVENSRSWRNSLDNEFGKQGTGSTGISAARDGDGLTEYAIIRRNEVWENWGEGVSTFESNQILIEDNISHDNYVTNIYISDATNVLCQRNFVYTDPNSYVFKNGDQTTLGMVGIMMGDEKYKPPSSNITVINNISYGNKINYFWWQGVQGGGMNNVLIANNTFVNSIYGSGVDIAVGSHSSVRFTNNLVRQDGPLPIIDTRANPEVQFSYNLWSKAPMAAATGAGDIVADPKLLASGSPYSAEWYKLLSDSPAIDKGRILSETTLDYFKVVRGLYPDIGAVEYLPP